mgnify:CR=1 FL=1
MKYILLSLSVVLLFSCSSQKETISDFSSSEPTQEKKLILALWDSLTAGYGVEESSNYPSQFWAMLEAEWYNYTLINAGVSGDTSNNLLDRADLYLEKNPDIVILVIGGNDGLRGLPTSEMKENIEEIISMYTQDGSKVVLWGMDIPLNLGLDYRSDFRQVYTDIAQENKEIYFLPFFLEGVAGKASLNLADKIHPTAEGYTLISQNLMKFLEQEDIIQK